MELAVRRLWCTDKSTVGCLYIDGVFECYSMEPPKGPIRIPAGTYQVILGWSPKFERLMPRLQDVPGWPRNDVEIHWGNYPNETEGCTMVGKGRGVDYLSMSRAAFDELYGKLLEKFPITYTDECGDTTNEIPVSV